MGLGHTVCSWLQLFSPTSHPTYHLQPARGMNEPHSKGPRHQGPHHLGSLCQHACRAAVGGHSETRAARYGADWGVQVSDECMLVLCLRCRTSTSGVRRGQARQLLMKMPPRPSPWQSCGRSGWSGRQQRGSGRCRQQGCCRPAANASTAHTATQTRCGRATPALRSWRRQHVVRRQQLLQG